MFRQAQQQRKNSKGTGESETSGPEDDWPKPPSQSGAQSARTADGKTPAGKAGGEKTDGASTAQGKTTGNNTAGGNTTGGNTASGNTAGGNTADGKTGQGRQSGKDGKGSGDKAFEDTLSDFDREIMDERAVIAARRNSAADGLPEEEAEADREGNGDGDGQVGDATSDAPTPSETVAGGGSPVLGGPPREGDYPQTVASTFPVPADVPSGSDDDVLARQLREAAMKEPDPELRERLWNEYRRYKKEQ